MILHIMMDEKFTSPFINFFNTYFDKYEQEFLVLSSNDKLRYDFSIENKENVTVVHKNFCGFIEIIKKMMISKKIILHGMFSPYIVYLLFFLHIAPKTYWCVWGGDLYDYHIESKQWKLVKTKVISQLKGIITPLEKDYQLAKEVYGANCKKFSCLGPNTIINQKKTDDYFYRKIQNKTITNILLGNSADSENRHRYLLEELKSYANDDIHIYIPLSYGNKEYAKEISDYAIKLFGDKVTPMLDYLPLEQYQEFLSSIDVAVFAHKRQQAFSNIIQMLSLGVKIYLMPNGAIWSFLKNLNINVFSVENINKDLLIPLDVKDMKLNNKIICKKCNLNNLIEEWQSVFTDQGY